MSAPFQLTPHAAEDIDSIWWFIAEDSREAADRASVHGFYHPVVPPTALIAVVAVKEPIYALVHQEPHLPVLGQLQPLEFHTLGANVREIVLRLLHKPAFGAAAEDLGQPDGHFRRDAALFVHQFG